MKETTANFQEIPIIYSAQDEKIQRTKEKEPKKEAARQERSVEKEENDDKYSPHAVVRHFRFACETESERDVWVDAIALIASLAKRGKSEHLKSCLLSLKTKRKKRVGFV